MEELVDAGLVRCLGVSSMTEAHMRTLTNIGLRIPPAIVTHESNPFEPNDEVRVFCQAQEPPIACLGFCPLRNGGPHEPGAIRLLDNETVVSVAEASGCTPAQTLLLWNIQRGVATIPKPDNLLHIKENIATLDIPAKLSKASMEKLLSLSNGEELGVVASLPELIRYMRPDMIVLSPAAQAAVAENEALQIAETASKGNGTPKKSPGPILPPDYLADGPDAKIVSEPHGRVSGFHLFFSYRVWCEKETAERLYLLSDDKRLAVTSHGKPIRTKYTYSIL